MTNPLNTHQQLWPKRSVGRIPHFIKQFSYNYHYILYHHYTKTPVGTKQRPPWAINYKPDEKQDKTLQITKQNITNNKN